MASPLSVRRLQERRRADSNCRIEVLQTSALPLGYGASRGKKIAIHRPVLKRPPEPSGPVRFRGGEGVEQRGLVGLGHPAEWIGTGPRFGPLLLEHAIPHPTGRKPGAGSKGRTVLNHSLQLGHLFVPQLTAQDLQHCALGQAVSKLHQTRDLVGRQVLATVRNKVLSGHLGAGLQYDK